MWPAGTVLSYGWWIIQNGIAGILQNAGFSWKSWQKHWWSLTFADGPCSQDCKLLCELQWNYAAWRLLKAISIRMLPAWIELIEEDVTCVKNVIKFEEFVFCVTGLCATITPPKDLFVYHMKYRTNWCSFFVLHNTLSCYILMKWHNWWFYIILHLNIHTRDSLSQCAQNTWFF